MPARNSFQCISCGALVESIGKPPDHECICGGTWKVVFTEVPQIRTSHASTVDHVQAFNDGLMSRKVEEAMSPGTEEYAELEAVKYHIQEHIPRSN